MTACCLANCDEMSPNSASSLPGSTCPEQHNSSGCTVATADVRSCVSSVLSALGEDIHRQGIADTPKRVAKAWIDMTQGYQEHVASVAGTAQFQEDTLSHGSSGLILVRDIHFASISQHNLFPFFGKLHVAYVPTNGVILGLSKFARIARCLSMRLQSQGQLACQMASEVAALLGAQGVAVLVEAQHFGGMSGPHQQVTLAATGCFTCPHSVHLQEFMLHLGRMDVPVATVQGQGNCSPAASLHAAVLLHHDGPDLVSDTVAAAAVLGAVPAATVLRMRDAVAKLLKKLPVQLPPKVVAQGARGYVEQLLVMTRGYRMAPPAGLSPPIQRLCESTSAANRPSSSASCQHAVHSAAARVAAQANKAPSGPLNARVNPVVGSTAICVAAAADMHCNAAPSPAGDSWPAPLPICVSQVSIPFTTLCEHHMLPFHGTAYILTCGDRPTDEKVALVVERLSCRLQVQERLTQQVADGVLQLLSSRVGAVEGMNCEGELLACPAGASASLPCSSSPTGTAFQHGTAATHAHGVLPAGLGSAGGSAEGRGVAVVCEAVHLCMVARGVAKASSRTVTSAFVGSVFAEPANRIAALRHLHSCKLQP